MWCYWTRSWEELHTVGSGELVQFGTSPPPVLLLGSQIFSSLLCLINARSSFTSPLNCHFLRSFHWAFVPDAKPSESSRGLSSLFHCFMRYKRAPTEKFWLWLPVRTLEQDTEMCTQPWSSLLSWNLSFEMALGVSPRSHGNFCNKSNPIFP